MKKGYLLLLFVLVGIQVAAFAGPRSFQQAKKIAERQATQLGIVMDEMATSQAKSVKNRTVSGEVPAYYVFPNGKDKGFTIVSGDDRLPEIVGYSVNGTYDEASLPANYVSFMKAYQEMVEELEKGDAQATASVAEKKALRSSGYQYSTVAPLLGEIAWNQYEPYNNMCPIYNGTDRAVTGCVATAMAQVMMYYKYPKELKEDIPTYVTKSYGVTVPGVSKGEKYDWDNMLPVYKTGGYNDVQAEAVAKLMRHCGAAVKMDYASSSAANVSPARLAKYFGYDADMMEYLNRETFTLAEWTQIIDKELEARRPILYAGDSSGSGHEFICDGSDGDGLYHINWGWGGSQNGYFDITVLNPKKGGAGSGDAPDGYNRSGHMIVGVAPDNGQVDDPIVKLDPIVVFYKEGESVFELVNSARDDVSETFSLNIVDKFRNQVSLDFNGYLAYGIKNADGSYSPISPATRLSLQGRTESLVTWSVPKTTNFDYAFPIGKTIIYALYSTDKNIWKKCAYQGMDPYVVEATATTLSIAEKELLSVSMNAQEELLSGMENELMLTISNPSDIEYKGMLNVYSNSTASEPSSVTEDLYVIVPAHSTINRACSITPAAGNLYVWVRDKDDNLLLDGQKFTVTQSKAPKLTVVKAWSNATPNLYENENAIFQKTVKIKAPKIEDDKAVFSYNIKNDGGTASVRYLIAVVDCEAWKYASYSYETVRLPGNGEVTTISREYAPKEGVSKTLKSELKITDSNKDEMSFTVSEPSYKLWTVKGSVYTMPATEMVVYVAGTTDGISSVSTTSSSYVRGGRGNIEILSDTTKHLNIYNLNGQKVADVKVEAGVQQNIPITSGLYIVDGKKIVVK